MTFFKLDLFVFLKGRVTWVPTGKYVLDLCDILLLRDSATF